VTSAEIILGLVTLQRAVELVISGRNTGRLKAGGAVEVSPGTIRSSSRCTPRG
jgi:hypothetical protein